jgi:hypothetical protein
MKKLMLFLVLLLSAISNSQVNTNLQYQALSIAEYAFLKSNYINYVCPLGRNTFLNNKSYFNTLTPGGKKLLRDDLEKFKTWNNDYFALDPNLADTLMMSSDFYDKTYFSYTVPITGYFKYSINNNNIDYIEIIEYRQFYNFRHDNQLSFNFIILVKYKYQEVTKFISDSYLDDCGQCQVY